MRTRSRRKIALLCLPLLLSFFTALAHADTGIDRKTFSLSLPDGWTEDRDDDEYQPDSFVFFENDESCLFTVIVGKKSAGASVESQLKEHRKKWSQKMTDPHLSDIDRWAQYSGQGFVIEGKLMGILKARTTVFAFERGDSVGVVVESATVADLRTYAKDFEKLRQSFRLK